MNKLCCKPTFLWFQSLFTVVEMLMVVSIMALLFAILIPSLGKSKKRAKLVRWQVYVNNLKADADLIGQYTFEETAYIQFKDSKFDTLPNSAMGFGKDKYDPRQLNGEVRGCAKTSHGRWPGKGAMYFPGNDNNYVTIYDNDILNPNEGSFAVAMWLKPTGNKKAFVLSKGNGRKKMHGWSMSRMNKRKAVCNLAGSQLDKSKKTIQLSVQSSAQPENEWSFWAMVIDRDNHKLTYYHNGEEVAAETIKNLGPVASEQPFSLLGRNALKGSPFKGYVDEVEIFQRALKPTEIKSAYEMGRP